MRWTLRKRSRGAFECGDNLTEEVEGQTASDGAATPHQPGPSLSQKRRKTKHVKTTSAIPRCPEITTTRRTALPTPEPSSLTESEQPKTAQEEEHSTDNLHESCRNQFPFMKLPAELRVHVYRMALQQDEPLLLQLLRPTDVSETNADTKAWVENSDDKAANRTEEAADFRNGAAAMGFDTTTIDGDLLTHVLRRRNLVLPSKEGSQHSLNVALLRTCQLVHKEARQVLYSENAFVLSLASGVYTLSALHQRSRSLIKHVTLTIPSHHDLLDGFADLVRLGLRYCWGLKKFTIVLQASIPDDRMMSGATSVYANAFHILRWLPKGCKVVLEGNVSDIVKKVVVEEGRLQTELDETSYLRRQHQMSHQRH